MIYMLLGMLLGVFFFISTIKAYSLGIKHGKDLCKGNVPQVNLNPIQVIKQHIDANEEKKKRDLEQEGWNGENGIMNYDPYKEVKEGE